MSDLKAEYEKLVEKTLPCVYQDCNVCFDKFHVSPCAAAYRPAIVELLLSERRKVLDRMSTDPHPPTDVLTPLRAIITQLQDASWDHAAELCINPDLAQLADELSALLPALETAIVERVKAAEEAGRESALIPLARNQPCGCVICICPGEEKCHGCGAKNCGTHPVGELPNPLYEPTALSRLLAAEREKIIIALYEEQNINEVQLQAAVECIRALGGLTPPLIDLRDKLRLVEVRRKEAVWWAGADWNRAIHQSNRLAELDSAALALRQQIAEWEK